MELSAIELVRWKSLSLLYFRVSFVDRTQCDVRNVVAVTFSLEEGRDLKLGTKP